MLWKANFFLNQSGKQDNIKITYGFKLRHHLLQHPKLEDFEKEVFGTVKLIKFRKVKDGFKTKLKKDEMKIKNVPNMFIFVDKTNNIYEMAVRNHEEILKNNITKTYRKTPPKLANTINLEAKYCREFKISRSNRTLCKSFYLALCTKSPRSTIKKFHK